MNAILASERAHWRLSTPDSGRCGAKQPSCRHQSDFLDVLCRRREQTLRLHLVPATVTRVAILMQLLGISKAPFYRFLSALVHRLAPLRQPVRILAFLAVFPDMPSDRILALGIAGTARQQGATAAQIRIRLIMPIAFTAGRAVEQSLALRADVVVLFRVVLILAFVKIPLAVTGSAIAEYRLDVLILQPFADRRNVVTGIKPHVCHLETKAILLAL